MHSVDLTYQTLQLSQAYIRCAQNTCINPQLLAYTWENSSNVNPIKKIVEYLTYFIEYYTESEKQGDWMDREWF